MHLHRASLLALALPLAFLTGCPADDTDDTGAEGSTTGTTTDDPTAGPTTEDPTAGPTTEDPGTTTDVPPDTDPTTTDPDSTGEPPPDMAMVRVMHLGVRAPAVDVFANGDGPVFTDLAFRNSTAYADVPAGDYTFQVSVAGTSADEAVLDPMLTLEPNTAYTAVAIGDLEMTDGAPGLQAIALVDDSADIAAGDVRITVVHAAPAVGQVDIWEISGEPIPLLENVDFGASATLDDIPAGPLEIGIDVNDDANPDVTFSVDASAAAGAQVNVYANNDEAGDVALVIQLPDGTVLPIAAN